MFSQIMWVLNRIRTYRKKVGIVRRNKDSTMKLGKEELRRFNAVENATTEDNIDDVQGSRNGNRLVRLQIQK